MKTKTIVVDVNCWENKTFNVKEIIPDNDLWWDALKIIFDKNSKSYEDSQELIRELKLKFELKLK